MTRDQIDAKLRQGVRLARRKQTAGDDPAVVQLCVFGPPGRRTFICADPKNWWMHPQAQASRTVDIHTLVFELMSNQESLVWA